MYNSLNTLCSQQSQCKRAAQMTKCLNNIWLAKQVAEYLKETAIQRPLWTRQNGAKTVKIVQEYSRLLDTLGMEGYIFYKTLYLNLILFVVVN